MRLFLFLILLLPEMLLAQSPIDSLSRLAQNAKEDTSRVNILNDLSIEYVMASDYGNGLKHAEHAVEIAIKSRFEKGLSDSYNIIGNIYVEKGDLDKALVYHFKCLGIKEKLGRKSGLVNSYNNIGLIYSYKGETEKAITYLEKSLALSREIKARKGISNSLTNLAILFLGKNEFDKSLDYLNQSLEIEKAFNDSNGIANTYINIWNVYNTMNNQNKSFEYCNKALLFADPEGSTAGIINFNLGSYHFDQKNFDQAEKFFSSSLRIARSIGAKRDISRAYMFLAKVDSARANFKSALINHKLYSVYQDSIFNDENKQNALKSEINYEFEKKEQLIRLEQEKKDAISNETLKRQKIQTYSFAGGLGLVFMLTLITWRAYSQKRKHNQIILTQKSEVEYAKAAVEEKQREIVDSITYAKRLQQAVLPPIKFIQQHLPESFILYKPKDIVAGDFYWMHKTPDQVLFAVADCTGHGVPGALVSIVCFNSLDRAVKEFSLTDPGKILDKTTELVLQTFEKSENEVKDGMDISLCCYDIPSKTLKWAGANNPIWLLRNNEIMEIKGNKQSVGRNHSYSNFTTHSISVCPNDTIYLFSDGFADQFGGPKGKKFKYSQLKESIISAGASPVKDQEAILSQTLKDWKGQLEQVDDICIMGVTLEP